jgi:hypothetical protein
MVVYKLVEKKITFPILPFVENPIKQEKAYVTQQEDDDHLHI